MASNTGVQTPVAPAPAFPSARALVEALVQGDEAARAELRAWLHEPLRKLMEELRQRHNLGHRTDRLVRHALHAAETYLRTRPFQQFQPLSLAALRSTLLLHVAKQALQPFGGQRPPAINGALGAIHAPEPLPEHAIYQSRAYFRPYEKVGSFWFGGDWYGGHTAADGALWVLVADITGHGYYAYLLASTLPHVWQACWRDPRREAQQPCEVLCSMHELLAQCLPDGVYVESTLLRFAPDGEVTVAPAGGSRLLFRSGTDNRLSQVRLRGFWLGLDRPRAEDQYRCTLAEGDEVLVGSDGVFDQLVEYQDGRTDVTGLLAAHMSQGALLEAATSALEAALRVYPQKDDITVVVVRRQPTTP